MQFLRDAGPLRRILLGFGAITFVVGVGLLGYAGYDLSRGEDERPSVPLVDIGDRPTPTRAPTEAPTEAPATPTPPPTPPLGDSPYVMVIDKIGVNNRVDTYGLDENAIPIVPEGPGAAQVIAWYDFSARPGVGSNAVFAGHVTWEGAAVFYNLSSLAAEDEVKLIGQDGTELVYRVSDIFQIDPDDPDSVKVMQHTDTDMITIITCDGEYQSVGEFGDYSHRLVVQARLDRVVPAGGRGLTFYAVTTPVFVTNSHESGPR